MPERRTAVVTVRQSAAEVKRERTWQVSRIGNNLNQIARWANTHKGVAAVADSLEFEHGYTSGVIAWTLDDHRTDEQIEAVLDDFEKTAWAGLEPDRYAWAAVLHREEDAGAHVHVLAAGERAQGDRGVDRERAGAARRELAARR